jgi:hypothetical protein
MKSFKIKTFLLAFSIATAPYFCFAAHAAIHLVTSDHEHIDQEEATPHHHEHHHGHHLVPLHSIPLGIVASGVQIQFSLNEAIRFFVVREKFIETSSQTESNKFLGKDPPPRPEPFISLLLHPTNAPPLR